MVIEKELSDVSQHRRNAIKAVADLPRDPTEEQVAQSGACKRCRDVTTHLRELSVECCQHCHALDILGTYDHKLFQARHVLPLPFWP